MKGVRFFAVLGMSAEDSEIQGRASTRDAFKGMRVVVAGLGLDWDFGDALADFEAGVADEYAAHGLGDGAVDGEAGDDVASARLCAGGDEDVVAGVVAYDGGEAVVDDGVGGAVVEVEGEAVDPDFAVVVGAGLEPYLGIGHVNALDLLRQGDGEAVPGEGEASSDHVTDVGRGLPGGVVEVGEARRGLDELAGDEALVGLARHEAGGPLEGAVYEGRGLRGRPG